MGILTTVEALAAARQVGLDLVEVAPQEKPPVCRIMDYGKFKYQQKKRQHKGHSHQVRIKEIRVRPKTGEHDINVKVSKAREFLLHKDKVLVVGDVPRPGVGPHRGRPPGDQRDPRPARGLVPSRGHAVTAGEAYRLYAGPQVERVPRREKGDSPHLCEAPFGPFRQMGTVPFFPSPDSV